jgi:probable rRNA maturation factor
VSLEFFNRQKQHRLALKKLREITTTLLEEMLECADYELGIYFVGAPAMAQINQEHLGHSGATDVITFDYGDPSRPRRLAGEIFVCVPVAQEQSRVFRVSWQAEIVRYIVHGILHLQGFDDLKAPDRRKMKQRENALMRRLARRFALKTISGAA